MTLAEGSREGYVESIIGVVHNEDATFRVEPIVMGAPWFDHPRNGDDCPELMWLGQDFGEILPEDSDEFSKAREVKITDSTEWQEIMSKRPEVQVKEAIAEILVVQHSHLIGDAVRATLRALTIQPGGTIGKYCVMDGMCTYRILKATEKIP